MKLTKQTNYAIRILIYCAVNQNNRSRISDIAKAYNVSELFLFKILQILVKKNFVKTVRGRNGGVVLAKDPKHITVADIVKATEENFALAECFETKNSTCPLVNMCYLNVTLQNALAAFFQVLNQTTIADLQNPNFKIQLGIKP